MCDYHYSLFKLMITTFDIIIYDQSQLLNPTKINLNSLCTTSYLIELLTT